MSMETKYNTRYKDCPDKQSFTHGLDYQDFIKLQFQKYFEIEINYYTEAIDQFNKGESIQGIEVKLDTRFRETGRLSIEIAEKSNADIAGWTPSGIYRSDNTWLYVQGDYQIIYIFAKTLLKGLYKCKKYTEAESHGTVRKFYLPLKDADKYCAKRIDINGDN